MSNYIPRNVVITYPCPMLSQYMLMERAPDDWFLIFTLQRSALLVAAEAGQAEAVTLLLKSGASPKTVNEHGQNVLDIAIAEKHE